MKDIGSAGFRCNPPIKGISKEKELFETDYINN
jgi:hypothetical protein